MAPIVFPEGSTALAKKYLSQNILDRLTGKRTKNGFSLTDALASGIANEDSSIGIYAGDEHSYAVFADLFNPIIYDYHKKKTHENIPRHPQCIDLPNPDPENRYILSSRIRVARNLAGYEFTCHIPIERRKAVERTVLESLQQMEGELKGNYLSMEHTPEQSQQTFIKKGLLFKKGDRFQEAAGMNKDFPRHRGVFHTRDKAIRIWVNEEDHLRIISIQKGASLQQVYERLSMVLKHLEFSFEFAWTQRLGYLASCPTNIGTSMRAGVHIRLKKLEYKKGILSSLARKHQLQIRGTGGEKTKVQDAVFDISNRRRFGISEADIMKNLCQGLKEIIQAERSL